jgi:DNA-binding response OmpR family regulator
VTARAAAVVEPASTIPVGEFQTATTENRFPFVSQIFPHERISELKLDAFQVALVPFRDQDNRARGSREENGGGDRMVILPITWSQLMARVRKEMDLPGTPSRTHAVQFGDVTVDLLSIAVRRLNREVEMTRMEFNVLRFFVLNPNRVISREELLDQVWGYENYPCTRTVDNHILKLRHKLEPEPAKPVYFATVHGIGYQFTPEASGITKS